MQSSLTQLLVKEHDVILDASAAVASGRFLWHTDPAGYGQMMSRLLDFFSAYGDEYHHRKEEEILFPAISKKNEMAGAAMAGELLDQHEDFRLLLQEIRVALDANEYASVQTRFENYIHALAHHIAAENDELFPMADALFSAEELERFYHRCLDKDSELGAERKERLELLTEQLKMIM